MKLQLKYKNQKYAVIQAAFIQGNTPKEWLSTLQGFNIRLSDLECYIIPRSKGDLSANGLFVVFPSIHSTQGLDLLFPYQRINDNLFIPIQSKLYPLVNDEEWKDILFYDHNFFHPTMGLIGFNLFDAINWKHLISFPELSEEKWSIAEKGNTPLPKLNKINILLPPQKNIIERLGKGIEKKPLSDLPNSKKSDDKAEETFFQKISRKFLENGLKGTNNFRNNFGSPDGKGVFEDMLSGLENWMRQNLDNLQKKRDDEINRLLDLFENDPEEALKYALPLDNKYSGRGQAPPSVSLGRRNTDFSLGGLGGGGRSDSWDVGDRYYKLMEKYRRTAEQLTKEKKYKKAAYIYANLLGDYTAAANVLKQGKHYHEAAALYKTHLNNKTAAAECYEEGGLYLKAIEVYKEIGWKNEKLGDLYTLIQQKKNARHYYRLAVDSGKRNQDYLHAGNILENKLGENKEARDLYLDGWKDKVQKEACLLRYFKLSENSLSDEVTDVYENHTSKGQQMNFLDILIQLRDKDNEEFQKASQNIAYEIVSNQSQSGNHKSLNKLKHFIQKDSLISSDISRFVIYRKERKKLVYSNNFQQTSIYELSKNAGIKWIFGRQLLNQFVAFGEKDKRLFVARWDTVGHSEMHELLDAEYDMAVSLYESYLYAASSSNDTERIIFYTGTVESVQKELPASQYFYKKLEIQCPSWLPDEMLGFYFHKKNTAVLTSVNGLAVFKVYNEKGELLETHNCKLEKTNQPLIAAATPKLSELPCRGSFYYMARGRFLMKLHIQGNTSQVDLQGATAQKLIVSPEHFRFRILVATDKGCILFRPTIKEGFNPCGTFFATEQDIQSMCFLKNHILIAYKNTIQLYEFNGDNTPQFVIEHDTSEKIASIHRGKSREECLVLTESGSLISYQLPLNS